MKTLWRIAFPKNSRQSLAENQAASRNEDMLNQNFKALFDAVTALEAQVKALGAAGAPKEGGA